MTQVDDTADVDVAGGRKATRGVVARAGRAAGGLLAGLMLLVILAAGGAYMRLASGPIDLAPFLDEIEAVASSRIPGASVQLGAASIALSNPDGGEGRGGATLQIENVLLVDDETGPFARIPAAHGAFDLADLMRGEIAPRDVSLTGISARLVRDQSGGFTFGFGGLNDTEEGEGAQAFARLLAAATKAAEDAAADPEETPASAYDPDGAVTVVDEVVEDAAAAGEDILPAGETTLRLDDASILYIDRLSGRAYRAEKATLSFWSAGEVVVADVAVTLEGGRHGDVAISLQGGRDVMGGVFLKAKFENAAPRDLADQIRALDWLAAFDAPIGGEIDVGLTQTGDLTALSGRFDGGAGRLALGGGVVEPIEASGLRFTFEPKHERFIIDEAFLEADRASFRGRGFVEVGRDEAGEPLDAVAQLDFSTIAVAAPEFLDAPLAYDSGRATGRVTLEPFVIEIGELRLTDEDMRLGVAGRLWRDGGDWRADMTFDAADLTLADMLRHWPRQAAPGALEWMQANMDGADIIEADAVLRMGGDAEEVKIDFTFENAKGHYLRPMPPIYGASGSGQVDLLRFSLGVDRGFVQVEGGEPIDLAGSTFVIADLEHPDTPGEANVIARGRAADALALIDEEPLGLASALGVPLGDVGGLAEISATASFPLLKALLIEDVQADARAIFTDVSLLAPGVGLRTTADELRMVADTQAFELKGDVVVAGTPASLTWLERFSPSSRDIQVRGVLTPERLEALGLSQDLFTDGSIPVTASISPGADEASFNAKADITRGRIAAPQIGWVKPAGEKGAFEVVGRYASGALDVKSFSLSSDKLTASGAVRTDVDGALKELKLDRLQYRNAVDLKVAAQRNDGGWRIGASGPLLDLTGLEDLIDEAIAGEEGGDLNMGVDPFRADLDIAKVRVRDDLYFSRVSGFASRDAIGTLNAQIAAAVSGGAAVDLVARRGPNGGTATLTAEDAGRLMRDAGVFDDGAGGSLRVDADIAPGDALRLTGDVMVRKITIHEDAKLQQMLAGAELEDLQRTMRQDGINFRKISADFSFDGERLELDDVIAKGAAIGVTLSGDYMMKSKQIDVSGVFTPFYALNSALGEIPVLGAILTGGEGQGLFAFNFSVEGDAADPKVRVNPLSVLTPGIFRKIFEIDDSSQDLPSRDEAAEAGDR